MSKEIRARFSNGKIEPLEALELSEGQEIVILVMDVPQETMSKDPFDRAAGAWQGTLDFEGYLKDLHASRRREFPEVTL